MRLADILKAIIAILFSEGAGLIGTFFTIPSIPTWYATLEKPTLNPPSWIFGPVWTTLYALMGVASFIVWKKGIRRRDVQIALGVFLIQLILNSVWSFIFFGLHATGPAFIEIVFLWIAIVVNIIVFARVSKPAAWLLLPYLAWVSFASYLNFSIWMLN